MDKNSRLYDSLWNSRNHDRISSDARAVLSQMNGAENYSRFIEGRNSHNVEGLDSYPFKIEEVVTCSTGSRKLISDERVARQIKGLTKELEELSAGGFIELIEEGENEGMYVLTPKGKFVNSSNQMGVSLPLSRGEISRRYKETRIAVGTRPNPKNPRNIYG